MKTPFALFLALFTFAFTCSTSDVYARTRVKKAQPPHIESVSAESITVKNGTQSRTYKITTFTSIELNGSKVPVSELKKGMEVTVVPGYDSNVAQSIVAGPGVE